MKKLETIRNKLADKGRQSAYLPPTNEETPPIPLKPLKQHGQKRFESNRTDCREKTRRGLITAKDDPAVQSGSTCMCMASLHSISGGFIPNAPELCTNLHSCL